MLLELPEHAGHPGQLQQNSVAVVGVGHGRLDRRARQLQHVTGAERRPAHAVRLELPLLRRDQHHRLLAGDSAARRGVPGMADPRHRSRRQGAGHSELILDRQLLDQRPEVGRDLPDGFDRGGPRHAADRLHRPLLRLQFQLSPPLRVPDQGVEDLVGGVPGPQRPGLRRIRGAGVQSAPQGLRRRLEELVIGDPVALPRPDPPPQRRADLQRRRGARIEQHPDRLTPRPPLPIIAERLDQRRHPIRATSSEHRMLPRLQPLQRLLAHHCAPTSSTRRHRGRRYCTTLAPGALQRIVPARWIGPLSRALEPIVSMAIGSGAARVGAYATALRRPASSD
ncbi:hypothetical protein AB0M46_04590 [Dactylosporangium sp. NPDC051485]|uniref:hypothetical protein n=1 Tax=Dactylosporangium sp. NPDC051485 TaxID=3154846 RepID=UPI00342C72F9